MSVFTGTSGDDVLTGTDGDDRFQLNQGGENTASGLGGNDVFVFGSTFDAGDQIDGGDGHDQLWLRGDYSAGVTLTDTTLTNIERIALGAGYDYTLTTADATVAAGATLTVDGSKLGAGNALTFDGSAETDGHFRLTGGAGDDTLTGGAQSAIFNLSLGGDDTVTGGAAADRFVMGAALSQGDSINGGGGNDTLVLDGNYGSFSNDTPFVLDAATMTNIARLAFAGTAANTYFIQENDANLAAGHTLTVDLRGLNVSSNILFDGRAETDGNFHFIGGGETFNLYGGSGNDVFDGTPSRGFDEFGGGGDDVFNVGANLGPSDQIDGGAGNDTVNLDGDYTQFYNAFFGPNTLLNIETLHLARGYNYSLDDMSPVASGEVMTVDASDLRRANTLVWAGERNGSYNLIGGAGDDVLFGGSQTNTFRGGGGADTLSDAGGGANIFVYDGARESNLNTVDRIPDFDASLDKFQFPFAVTSLSTVSATLDDLRHSLIVATHGEFSAYGAVLVTAAAGALSGHVYLVVDANGNAAYTPGADYVIDITAAHGAPPIGIGNFTI